MEERKVMKASLGLHCGERWDINYMSKNKQTISGRSLARSTLPKSLFSCAGFFFKEK